MTVSGNYFADVVPDLLLAKMSAANFEGKARCSFINSNNISCTVPPVDVTQYGVALNESFSLKLEVGMNDYAADYTNSKAPIIFQYYTQPSLDGGEVQDGRMAAPQGYLALPGTRQVSITITGAPFVPTQVNTFLRSTSYGPSGELWHL